MINDADKNSTPFMNKGFFSTFGKQNLINERKKYKFINLSFYIISFGQILLMTFFYFYFNCHIKIDFHFLNENHAIYVVSIVNSPNWVRSTNLWNMWGKDFVIKYPLSDFKFVSFQPNSNFSNRLLLTEVPIKNYRGFFYLFNKAVEDFLNTKYQWIYRTTEDCLVDVDLFGKYMENLTSHYSPSTNVIKGHAVEFASNMFFIHGGSGWIMSRAAAKAYYDNIRILSREYNSNPTSGDDVLIGWFAHHLLNLSFKKIDDPYFLGSPYQNSEVTVVQEKKWNTLPNCTANKILQQKPIKQIIFWHSGRKDNYPMNIGIKAKDVYPPNVYYDQNSNPRRLCLDRNN